MNLIFLPIIIIIAFTPGLFWLFYFYHKDKYEPEPKNLIFKTFFRGILCIIPAIIIEFILCLIFFGKIDYTPDTTYNAFFLTFIIIAPAEEIMKFLAARRMLKHPEFDEVLDGVIYSIAAGLGFASLENLMYMFSYGFFIIILRALTSTLAHALFSGFVGYGLGMYKIKGGKWKKLLPVFLIVAIVLHGAFNFIIFTMRYQLIFIVILLLLMLITLNIIIKKLALKSKERMEKLKSQTDVQETPSEHVRSDPG